MEGGTEGGNRVLSRATALQHVPDLPHVRLVAAVKGVGDEVKGRIDLSPVHGGSFEELETVLLCEGPPLARLHGDATHLGCRCVWRGRRAGEEAGEEAGEGAGKEKGVFSVSTVRFRGRCSGVRG